jgi:hypothetical protein
MQKLEEIIKEYGREPDLQFNSKEYKEKSTYNKYEDVADEYVLFIDEESMGGCILYASYDNGVNWEVNPNLRFPVYFLFQKTKSS